jgi:hypothetical protein
MRSLLAVPIRVAGRAPMPLFLDRRLTATLRPKSVVRHRDTGIGDTLICGRPIDTLGN